MMFAKKRTEASKMEEKVTKALGIIWSYAGHEGNHHRMWGID